MLKTKQMKTLLAAGLFAPVAAFATNGILPYGNGMSAHGVGGAGIANPADAMSAVDNPALLAKTGGQASVGASFFNPNRSADLGSGYVESESDWFIIPQAAWNGSGEPFNWGISAYALGGMNTDYPGSLMGVSGNVGVDLSGLIVAPTASYQLSPAFAVGASVLLGYARLETENIPGSGSKSDSATGWGVKLGANWDVSKTVALGVTVQPKMYMSKMDSFCNDPIFAGTDCEVSLPDLYGIGSRFALSEKAVFVADIVQAQWSDVEVFNSGSAFSPRWEDQTIFKLGMEFHAGEGTIYRVGYNHGDSPVPDNRVANNVFFPAVTEDHLSAGFTKRFGGTELIGYYAYVFENEQTQAGATAPRIKMNQNALGIGGNWKF